MTTDYSVELNKAMSSDVDQGLDINYFFSSIFRQKGIILFLSSFIILLSGIYAFTRPKIWKGDFQIVLDSKSNSNSNSFLGLAYSPCL